LPADFGPLRLGLERAVDIRRVKFGTLTPILCAMRASRFAPFCALFVFAAAIAVAVLTSRAEDWD